MSTNWGTQIELSLFGESHGEAIGIIIGRLPAGLKLDFEAIDQDMKRRAPGRHHLSTSRKEADQVRIVSGLLDGVTTGAPLCAIIENTNKRSGDYRELQEKMRPSHSDYPAYVKFQGFNDVRGGGMFSGRLTAPIVFAGAIAKQILKEKGVEVKAHILSIKDIQDDHFPYDHLPEMKNSLFPVLKEVAFEQMEACILEAARQGDSVGGKIECMITGVQAGIGDPFFDSMESHLSQLLFSIPAVKSVSFGDLDDMTRFYGSEVNDAYVYDENKQVKTTSNHNGGILGGITNGMPILFQVGIKPTASISKPQETINVKTKENVSLELKGRHDPCIVPRAVVVVEAMAALGLLDMMR